jgi:hypothetical protein
MALTNKVSIYPKTFSKNALKEEYKNLIVTIQPTLKYDGENIGITIFDDKNIIIQSRTIQLYSGSFDLQKISECSLLKQNANGVNNIISNHYLQLKALKNEFQCGITIFFEFLSKQIKKIPYTIPSENCSSAIQYFNKVAPDAVWLSIKIEKAVPFEYLKSRECFERHGFRVPEKVGIIDGAFILNAEYNPISLAEMCEIKCKLSNDNLKNSKINFNFKNHEGIVGLLKTDESFKSTLMCDSLDGVPEYFIKFKLKDLDYDKIIVPKYIKPLKSDRPDKYNDYMNEHLNEVLEKLNLTNKPENIDKIARELDDRYIREFDKGTSLKHFYRCLKNSKK